MSDTANTTSLAVITPTTDYIPSSLWTETNFAARYLNPDFTSPEQVDFIKALGKCYGLNAADSMQAFWIVKYSENNIRVVMKTRYMLALYQKAGIKFRIIKDAERVTTYYDKFGNEWDERTSVYPPPYFDKDDKGEPKIVRQLKRFVLDECGNYIPLDENGIELAIHPSRYMEIPEADGTNKKVIAYLTKDGSFYKELDKSGKLVVSSEVKSYKTEPVWHLIPAEVSGLLNDYELQTVIEVMDDEGNWKRHRLLLSKCSKRKLSSKGEATGPWYTETNDMMLKDTAIYIILAVHPRMKMYATEHSYEQIVTNEEAVIIDND